MPMYKVLLPGQTGQQENWRTNPSPKKKKKFPSLITRKKKELITEITIKNISLIFLYNFFFFYKEGKIYKKYIVFYYTYSLTMWSFCQKKY